MEEFARMTLVKSIKFLLFCSKAVLKYTWLDEINIPRIQFFSELPAKFWTQLKTISFTPPILDIFTRNENLYLKKIRVTVFRKTFSLINKTLACDDRVVRNY